LPIISAIENQRQEDHKFKANMNYLERTYLKKKEHFIFQRSISNMNPTLLSPVSSPWGDQ
jgi:hypothetical protein